MDILPYRQGCGMDKITWQEGFVIGILLQRDSRRSTFHPGMVAGWVKFC
jgi:hypothetical protein